MGYGVVAAAEQVVPAVVLWRAPMHDEFMTRIAALCLWCVHCKQPRGSHLCDTGSVGAASCWKDCLSGLIMQARSADVCC